jgi:hypothetical protein
MQTDIMALLKVQAMYDKLASGQVDPAPLQTAPKKRGRPKKEARDADRK